MEDLDNKPPESYKLIEVPTTTERHKQAPARDKWGKGIEFLLSCISLSVGLGNVWRFPFVALENGGGAFLIPYVVVLVLVGGPVYYLEILIGQFCSRGCVQAYEFSPIMRGVGYGQAFATILGISYYASILGLTIRYLLLSFTTELPWAFCEKEWGSTCINSSGVHQHPNISGISTRSSAELFYFNNVLHEVDSIEDGVGLPDKYLVGCLGLAWIGIGGALIKGIKSSGKALYFLAVFPYVVLITLLVRAVSLEGALDGVLYFLAPQWNEILNVKVWYAAISQAFFSMAICFGTLMMFGSYNEFTRNVQRDVLIVTIMNLIVSVVAGCIIFAILGNLALETGTTDIKHVVKGGTGLAFISYPDAIAKFDFAPQLFAVLFFSMLLCLAFGSNIGMTTGVIAVIKDRFDYIPNWILTITVSIIGFALGIVYTTPGGQYILNLVDFFGVSFIALVLAIAELAAISWIYGVRRFCNDIEFMLGIKTGYFVRACWGIIAPGLMQIVLVYTLIQFSPLRYNGTEYPKVAYYASWALWATGVGQLPIWGIYSIYKQPQDTWFQKFKSACRPSQRWGPLNDDLHESYVKYRTNVFTKRKHKDNIFARMIDNIFGQ